MKRRAFITLLGGAAAAWPLAARAQQTAGKIVSIGILVNEAWPPIDTFRQTLNELGYVEGKNLRFEHRYAAEQRDEIAALHSITSSARASSVGDTSRPNALAVLRLMTSSYLVGACTGKSPGFSPLRMRST